MAPGTKIPLATKSQLAYPRFTVSNQSSSSAMREKVCPQPALCPLNKVRVGMAVRVKQLSAPPDVIHRLREMGFCEEQQIRLLSHQSSIVCLVCNARLAISSQLAENIWVEPLAAQQSGS
jgi:ferrous iron transport protein A